MCHRFGQRKRGTKFVTFRFSYFDACAGPGAGRAVFVEQPPVARRPPRDPPVPAPPRQHTRQWTISQRRFLIPNKIQRHRPHTLYDLDSQNASRATPRISALPLPHPDIGAAIIPAASWPRRVADSTDGTGEGLERAELGCVHPSSVPGSGSGRWWTRSPPGPQLLMPPARHRAWSQPSTATCTWPHALATPHGRRLARMRRRHVCRGRSPGGHRPVLS